MTVLLENKGRRDLWIVTPGGQTFILSKGSTCLMKVRCLEDVKYFNRSYGQDGLRVEIQKERRVLNEVMPETEVVETEPIESVVKEEPTEVVTKTKRKPRSKLVL